jgi:hypothetical protein
MARKKAALTVSYTETCPKGHKWRGTWGKSETERICTRCKPMRPYKRTKK